MEEKVEEEVEDWKNETDGGRGGPNPGGQVKEERMRSGLDENDEDEDDENDAEGDQEEEEETEDRSMSSVLKTKKL